MSDILTSARTPERFNSAGARKLPGHLGIVITEASDSRVAGELPVVESVMAPNGYLHAGTIVTLADTVAGYGCVANLPADATGFTTIELKSNHLGTARDGTIIGVATPVHRGRTTQVWDAVVVHKESGRTLAVFRCTQMILYTKQKSASELP
ncbi:MAG TPA: PaaI family thioesterase [Steroidobacteraceae bacterium]|nr:PaaI family thioesterase [Steroidobacteraceae bacterium]